jgi:hypothetical protein
VDFAGCAYAFVHFEKDGEMLRIAVSTVSQREVIGHVPFDERTGIRPVRMNAQVKRRGVLAGGYDAETGQESSDAHINVSPNHLALTDQVFRGKTGTGQFTNIPKLGSWAAAHPFAFFAK